MSRPLHDFSLRPGAQPMPLPYAASACGCAHSLEASTETAAQQRQPHGDLQPSQGSCACASTSCATDGKKQSAQDACASGADHGAHKKASAPGCCAGHTPEEGKPSCCGASLAGDDACCTTPVLTDATDACGCGCAAGKAEHGDARKELWILGISALAFGLTMIFETNLLALLGQQVVWLLYFIPYAVCGLPVFRSALQLMRNGNFLNEFTLMCGATVAALGLGETPEAVGVMLFYRLGEFVQERATAGSRKSIKGLLAAKPTLARRLEEGSVQQIAVEDVRPGDLLVIRAGEKIPVDGVVVDGSADVDQSPLTGESLPVTKEQGDEVLGGTISMGGVLTMKASGNFTESHMARILHMVENAAAAKSPTERFITRFAKYYTPAVFGIALLIAFVPPLILPDALWKEWIYKALVLLVISCPCALLISIPLGYFGGIGGASRQGILVKGGTVLDALMHIDTVVFDKTGTLTQGSFGVSAVMPAPGVSENDLLAVAGMAEQYSNHPLARSIVNYVNEQGIAVFQLDLGVAGSGQTKQAQVQEIGGKGLQITLPQGDILAGTASFLREQGVPVSEMDPLGGAEVHIARYGEYMGLLHMSDTMKAEAQETISALHQQGKSTYMLTGDNAAAASVIAAQSGITRYAADLLPEDKVAAMEKMLTEQRHVAFVGDGINDAPILALSHVGIAMGKIGSEAAIEAADVVIVNDSLEKVVQLFHIARKVRFVVWENIALALGVKTTFMVLGVAGLSGLWEAVFADVGVALLAVLNSVRVIRTK